VVSLPSRAISVDDAQRFAAYLAFYRDGASMSEAQFREHLKEKAFVAWLQASGYGAFARGSAA
jgi:hypothetical protein